MILINPDNLSEVWAEVKHGLEVIKAKTKERWIPEDIYHDLKLKQSLLYMRQGAFLVLKADGQELSIWCAYNTIGGDFASGFEWVKEHAKQHGFKRLTMTSPRKGWQKHFNLVSYNYEVEL